MKGEWIKKPQGVISVVFVHGILSSGETCWRHENGSYWPELLSNETGSKDLGIYVYTYQAGVFSGSYSLSDVVDDLKERMRVDGLFENKQIVFVCHSMGGIVVRKFLVERSTYLLERKLKIGLFLVASPSLGAKYANWLSPLAKFFGHTQAEV
ncbi:MAG: alpha/beta fold hydrolase, partial [Bacteroidetes bacterium]|nr:alpha/beta fold hydrolase [Bacteroidota bacterium]